MKKLIIFYDDTKTSCCGYTERFSQYQNVECRKASDVGNQRLIFARNCRVGLVFESENGKVPYAIMHVIWRLIADKKERHLLLVSGGKRELRAIHAAAENLRQRGYHPGYIYTGYQFEKQKVKEGETVPWIMSELQEEKENVPLKDSLKNMSKRELRKQLRKEIKQYRQYKKGME